MSGSENFNVGTEIPKELTSTRIFYIVVIIITGIIFGSLIANAVYFRKISNNGGGGGITKGVANVMFYFNLVMALAAGIVFVYAMVKLFVPPKIRTGVSKSVQNYAYAPAGSGNGFVDNFANAYVKAANNQQAP